MGAIMFREMTFAVADAFALLLLIGGDAHAECLSFEPALDGVYTLDDGLGIRSQLTLRPNGEFAYKSRRVGSADETATGCWRRRGDTVTLLPSTMQVIRGVHGFGALDLQLDAAGDLVRVFDATRLGVYVRSLPSPDGAPVSAPH